jgi:hypothetical protein
VASASADASAHRLRFRGEVDELQRGARRRAQPLALGALQRQAGDDRPSPGVNTGCERSADAIEPGPAVLVSQLPDEGWRRD